MLAAHEKAFACYDSCPESEMYRTLVFLVFSLHIQELTRNAYNNLNYWSEKRLKRLQNDSTMALISFTKVAREAGAMFWLVYSSNIIVCEALALSEGDININKTSHSFFAA